MKAIIIHFLPSPSPQVGAQALQVRSEDEQPCISGLHALRPSFEPTTNSVAPGLVISRGGILARQVVTGYVTGLWQSLAPRGKPAPYMAWAKYTKPCQKIFWPRFFSLVVSNPRQYS